MTAQEFVDRFFGPGASFDEVTSIVTIRHPGSLNGEECEIECTAQLLDGRAQENIAALEEAVNGPARTAHFFSIAERSETVPGPTPLADYFCIKEEVAPR